MKSINKEDDLKFDGSIRGNNYANWIIYRLTDVMLMKAEALVQKALLQSKANAGLLDQIAAATTVEDSLAIAQEIYQINQSISKCNVKAARLAQIVNLRALTKTDLTQVIDSTKYAVSNTEYDGLVTGLGKSQL